MVKTKKAKGSGKPRETQVIQWCFTLNNPVISKEDLAKKLEPFCKYLVIGDEIGENATPHLQGYMELSNRKRMSQVSLLFAPAKPHLEPKSKNSTRHQAAVYCKKDGNFVEVGTAPPAPGIRKTKNLELICADIVAGKSLDDAILNREAAFVQNHNGLKKLVEMQIKPANIRPMEVILLFGKTGAGKTYFCFEHYPELFKKPIGKALWFDGYKNQKVVLIDEFRGQFPLSDMLQILDKYKTQVEVKGGHTWLTNEVLLLTTNKHPSLYYGQWSGLEEEKYAFFRRLSKVYFFKKRDEVEEFVTQEDILNFCENPPFY